VCEKWNKKMMYHHNEWMKHVFKRSDPGHQVNEVKEAYGDYIYFVKQQKYPSKK